MKSFNEWLSKTDGVEPDINEEESIVANQLEQFVDRIMGILHNVSEEKRSQLVEKLISDLSSRCKS